MIISVKTQDRKKQASSIVAYQYSYNSFLAKVKTAGPIMSMIMAIMSTTCRIADQLNNDNFFTCVQRKTLQNKSMSHRQQQLDYTRTGHCSSGQALAA